jgi:plasmid stabilization system protein ParE
MTGLPVHFTALAEEDLDQIEDYISASNPVAAARVRATIVQNSLRLGTAPKQGRPLKDPTTEAEVEVRLLPVSRHRNYLILYRIEPEQVRVLRILHAARDWTRFFGES